MGLKAYVESRLKYFPKIQYLQLGSWFPQREPGKMEKEPINRFSPCGSWDCNITWSHQPEP